MVTGLPYIAFIVLRYDPYIPGPRILSGKDFEFGQRLFLLLL
jgi:hypothetical protein